MYSLGTAVLQGGAILESICDDLTRSVEDLKQLHWDCPNLKWDEALLLLVDGTIIKVH